MRRLREQGVALVYITHRLDEVREIADRVVVLRDGDVVLQGQAAELGRRDLVSAMVGRSVGDVHRPEGIVTAVDSTPLLRYRGATSATGGRIRSMQTSRSTSPIRSRR